MSCFYLDFTIDTERLKPKNKGFRYIYYAYILNYQIYTMYLFTF